MQENFQHRRACQKYDFGPKILQVNSLAAQGDTLN